MGVRIPPFAPQESKRINVTSMPAKVDPKLTRENETRRRLDLTIPAAEMETATEEAARQMGRKLRIPGFRRGHVPTKVVRQRFARELQEEVIEQLASRHVAAFMDSGQEDPVAPPVLKEQQVVEDGSLKLVAIYEVQPPVQLGEYRGLAASRPSTTLSDQEVDDALESIRMGMTRLHPVEDRGAAEGDDILVDMEGLDLEGEEKGVTFRREGIGMRLAGDDVHPELWKALLGAQTGFCREVTVAYPDDYRTKGLAGRTIRYQLNVKSVRQPRTPLLDDDLARNAGDFKDLAELRQRVQEDLQHRKEKDAHESVRQSLLNQLLERHPLVVPQVLVDQEVHRRLESIAHQLARQGVDPTQAGVDWPKEKERQAERVREDLRAARLLDAIAEAEKLEVKDVDMERHLAEEAARANQPLPVLRASWQKDGRLDALHRHLRRDAVLDFLSSVGHIQKEGESA
ncbi:MAG: trigger factor [Acidobacteria bacterium]|nr:MAG: trigger factor [Acidobacteriota bacterium]